MVSARSNIYSISSLSIPKTIGDAFAHLGWRQIMIVELCALQKNGTWDFISLSFRKVIVGCRQIFAIKDGPDNTIDWLKDCLIVKGYT